ncbi:MAG: SDR family oxidoreductase [Burkholderiales bacterium]|nr:SDR family oxidoreductase [Burkholderiales bacterium]
MSALLRDFEGKGALVTAAGAGIGRSIALDLARRGAAVLVTDRSPADARQVADEIDAAGGRAQALQLDVKDAQGIRDAVDATVALAGGLDLLFNVAGINIPKNVEMMEEDEWASVLDVNLTSIYRSAKHAIPQMRRRGGGAIVNVASIAGVLAENRCGAYSASKGGVVLLTRNMAMDFARDNIRVNAVCPGSTRTPRTEGYWRNSPTGKSEMAELCPMKRSAEPEEIARPAIFLASADASYITGAILVVDGGMTAGFRIPTFDRM